MGIYVMCIALKFCNNTHIRAVTYKSLWDLYSMTMGHYVANRTQTV